MVAPSIYSILIWVVGYEQLMVGLFYIGLVACVMRSSRLLVLGVLCLIASASYFTFSDVYVESIPYVWVTIVPLGAIAYVRYKWDHLRTAQ